MPQAIEQRVDQGLFLEQFVPVVRIEIGCDDRRDAVVALVHQAEEGIDLFRLEGQVAEFVDDQWLEAAELGEQLRRRAIGERSIEFVEQRLGVVETAAITSVRLKREQIQLVGLDVIVGFVVSAGNRLMKQHFFEERH